MKLAVALLGLVMLREHGLPCPAQSPLQLENAYPELAIAVSCTPWLGLYQGPLGLRPIVPLLNGLTVVLRRYWVVKLAVYVASDVGTVIEWVCPPLSLQAEKTYRVR
jgi:hypothetical protein